MGFSWFSEYTVLISLNSINKMIFVVDRSFLWGKDSILNVQTNFGFKGLNGCEVMENILVITSKKFWGTMLDGIAVYQVSVSDLRGSFLLFCGMV
jgi:hypothetical protein